MQIKIKIEDNKFLYTIDLHDKCNIHYSRLVTYSDVILFGKITEQLQNSWHHKDEEINNKEPSEGE